MDPRFENMQIFGGSYVDQSPGFGAAPQAQSQGANGSDFQSIGQPYTTNEGISLYALLPILIGGSLAYPAWWIWHNIL